MDKFEDSIVNHIENPLEYNLKKELQMYLMNKMIGENANDKAILNWIDKYAKDVSRIVDDEKNITIRELVISRKFEEASNQIMEKIKKQELTNAA